MNYIFKKVWSNIDRYKQYPRLVGETGAHASDLRHGAGPIVAKTLKDKGVGLIVSGELGPGASTLLETIARASVIIKSHII
jgi:hypothetical protein